MENDLDGIPVVDAEGEFKGIVSKDRINQVVISQLLDKSQKIGVQKMTAFHNFDAAHHYKHQIQ